MVANFDKPNPYPSDWALTPVKGKAAYLQNWRDRPIPINQIRRYWAQKQCTGLGVVLGQLSNGLVAVDIDGESARDACGELPPTVISSSGKPGRSTHYYRLPEQYWDAAKHVKIPTGDKEQLELRWTGQQVLPPSIHPETNRPYQWIASPETVAVAEAPEWLILKMCCQDQPPSATAQPRQRVTGDGVVDLVQCLAKNHQDLIANGAGEGGRDNSGAALARDLIGTANYLTQMGVRFEGDPRQLLADYCSRCTPPLSSRDCDRIYNSAEKSNPQPSVPLDKIQDRVDWQQGKRKQRQPPQPQRAGGEIVLHPSLESDTADVRTKFKHVSQQLEVTEAARSDALSRQIELLRQFNAADPLKQGEIKPALDLVKAEITQLNSALKPLNRQRNELRKLVTALDIQDRQQTAKAGKDDRSSWKQDVEVMEARLIGRLRYNTLKEMAEIDMGDWWEPLSPNSVNYQMKHAIGFDNWKQSDNANSRILRDMAQKEPFGRRYNPVRDYLNDLGQRIEPDFELLETLAKRVFNIDDPLQNLFIKAAIIAAVARGIAEDDAAPIKWRHMPILVGEQHCGKSDFIRYLVGGEENPGNIFGSGQLEFKTKDSIIESRPFWVFEFEEVDTVLLSRGSVQSSIKAFLSRVTDSYRPVHGRDTIEVKRFTTFWGTSNNEHLLSDSSGDSRFLIIRIPDGYSVPDHIWRWLIANRDLIWGTAVHAYFREGIPRIATDVLKEHNQEFQNQHHWHDLVSDWVMSRAEPPSTRQILEHALGIEPGKQKEDDSQAIRGIMQRLGYKTQRTRTSGSTTRTYVWVPKN